MPNLSILLLGPFQATLDGAPVTGFVSDKARALLAYLAVEADQPHRREALAGLLWPDVPEQSARTSLRTALANVRQVIGDSASTPFLHVTRQSVQFNRHSDAWVDALTFTDLLETPLPRPASEPVEPSTVQCLEDALAQYRGSFLEGFTLADSVLFEEWALLKREQLQRQALTAQHRLAAHYEAGGEPLRALQHAWRAVDLDPWPGAGQRQLMRLLALSGRREAALAQYQAYRQLLAEELEVEPSEATRGLYELLSEGEWPPDMSVSRVILERDVVTADPCPYRGLAAFREQDAPFFFGREGFVARLASAVRQKSMVAVIVGSSGCGKSSTVFAGLLPGLREAEWLIAAFRPGRRPFRSLTAALLPLMGPDSDAAPASASNSHPGNVPRATEFSLQQAVERALQLNPGAGRFLLVVDQFEELYTLCPDPEVRRRFLDELLGAVEAEESSPAFPFVLLLTLRADFMGQALAHRPFADALQDASLLLGPMTRDELRAAIEKPAQKQGVVFETGLVERILDDVGEEPGNLPLLEFALTLLWEQQSYGWLTHAGYEQIGRVEGAVARYADEVYGDLDPALQTGARHVFVQLVHPGEGTEDTRRQATRAELGEETWNLVRYLADKRLVVTARDTAGQESAELVHEALIQGWDHLRIWMDLDRAFRTWQERLRATLRAWEVADRDEGALLRGAPLAEAESWLTERGSELSGGEKAFIQAGVALREQRVAQRDAQQRRELEAAQKLAAAESQRAEERARSAARLRRRAVYLGLALIVALIAAVVAGVLGNRSANLATENAASAGTAQAASTRAVGQGAAAQTARALEAAQRATAQSASTQAVSGRATAETAQALEEAQRATALAESVARATAEAVAIQEREDARRQAGIGLASQAELQMIGPNPERAVLLALEAVENFPYAWQTEHALGQAVLKHKLLLDLRHGAWVNRAYLSPDETRIMSSGDDGRAVVWAYPSGEELFALAGLGNLGVASWSPSGDRILGTGQAGVPTVWDADSGQKLVELSGHEAWYANWSPDGTRILTFYSQQQDTAVVWDAASGKVLQTLPSDKGIVKGAAWSPDGTRIVSSIGMVWDAATGMEPFTLSEGRAWAYSPDGSLLAGALPNGTVRVLSTVTGDEMLTTSGGHGAGLRISTFWSPSGDRFLTVGADDVAKVWNAETGEELFTLPGVNVGTGFHGAWSPDGTLILTAGDSGEMVVWDSATGKELLAFAAHSAEVAYFEWLPSGDRIITTSADGSAKVWDVSEALFPLGCQPSCPVSAVGGWYSAATWSPSGEQAARGFVDSSIRVWDVTSGDEVLSIQYEPEVEGFLTGGVGSVAWSPEGSRLLTTANDGVARLWDATTGEALLTLPGHGAEMILSAAWSPDGTRILTYSQDGSAKVWDADTGELHVTFTEHNPFAASWSPDGSLIVTSDEFSEIGSAKIWDAASGEVLRDLFPKDFRFGVSGAAWAPDGARIVTFSEDKLGRIWDANTGEELLIFAGLSGASGAMWSPEGDRFLIGGLGGAIKAFDALTGEELVNYDIGMPAEASWSPDGKHIAVSDWEGNLKILPAWQSLEELIAYAYQCCVFRELTPDERQLFGLPPR
jgi:WD40 repeat protein/DNA-binding SARP family transcriptional activator